MGLGRGLSALISDKTVSEIGQGYIPDVPVDDIKQNPYQPRISINPESLVELSDSIREHGIIEPLIVTRRGDRYELIAGERRWRAAKMAKVPTVPVIVKEVTPQQVLELALIENIQRKDLNPLEEALAFEQLMKLFNLKADYIAKRVSLSRAAVANKVRLLNLPEKVKKYLLEEKIQEGHARALLGLNSGAAMEAACKVIIRDKLSVRAVEELVRRLIQDHKRPVHKNTRMIDEFTQNIERDLRSKFGERVKLFRTPKGGQIVIPFASNEEFERICRQMLT